MTFDFNQDILLENERALLRPLQESDIIHLSPFAIHEPEIWTYSLVNAGSEAGMQEYISQALLGKVQKKEYPFIVYDKKIESYAGSTRFYDIRLESGCLQLGFTWYGKKYQGSGLNKHCKFLMLDFAFNSLNITRVELRADAKNKRSIQAMISLGCTVEGILRSNGLRPDGTRRDSIILSILKSEWENGLKDTLINKLTN
jgi:RimJ/RimL family protein N-acetyltransferase